MMPELWMDYVIMAVVVFAMMVVLFKYGDANEKR
jgi:hypothetical protein